MIRICDFNRKLCLGRMLPRIQIIRLALVMAGIVVVYGGATLFLLSALVRRPEAARAKRWYPVRTLTFALALVGLLCGAYGYFIEPYWPQVTHVSLTSRNLMQGTRMRIVQFSDLHSDSKLRLEEGLPNLIAEQHPDVIVFTGDLANSAAGSKRAHKLFESLSKIAPIYAVLGNWDGSPRVYAGTGAQLLMDRPVEANVGGAPLVIIGAAMVGNPARLLPSGSNRPFTLLLHHYPDAIEDVARTGAVDLYCAGHTHGGQVRLPLYGAVITFSRWDKKYESGLYKVGQTYLYVNRGVGLEGGGAPPVRFLARPEIAVIDVTGMPQ